MTGAGLKPKGNYAVMASREGRAPGPDVLDDFPTPPWATRALLKHVLPACGVTDGIVEGRGLSVWEPACGRGIMAEVLGEHFGKVHASDVHDYGKGYAVGSFTGNWDRASCPFTPDWIVTNPPFKLAEVFCERALGVARRGVAMLVRLAFLEGVSRYSFFLRHPYSLVCPFVERVPMVKGRWDPEASTATCYAWFVWCLPVVSGTRCGLRHIPPGCRKSLTHVDDIERFAQSEAPRDHGVRP